MSDSDTDRNVPSRKASVTPSPKKDQENLQPTYGNHGRDERIIDTSSDSEHDPSNNNHKRVLAGYDIDEGARKRTQKRARKEDRTNGRKGYRSSKSASERSNILNHPDVLQNRFKRNANHQRNPASTVPTEGQSKDTKHPKHALPATDYAPAYDSKLFSLILKDNHLPYPLSQHLEHLNCFQLSHAQNISAPSIVQLKQHTQAMCLLLHLLYTSDHNSWPHVAPPTPFPTAFDFLDNLKEPYSENNPDLDESDTLPLRNISNILSSAQPGIGNVQGRNKAELLTDANSILTRLDHLYNSTGGILSIPPPEPESDAETKPTDKASRPTNLARDSILAQWLAHTRALTIRLASLEAETASLRQVLAHEAVVAGVRAKQSRAATNNGDGSSERELIFPQDRYVLAGLSEGLWERLNEELSARETETHDAEHDAEHDADADAEKQHDLAQGRGVQARGSEPFSTAPGTNDPPERNVVSWIEVTSRLYRTHGSDTIFVIPGFGLDPSARALHAIERESLVQTVPARRPRSDVGAGAGAGTAWERGVAREREALLEALAAVEAELAREREEGKSRVEEAERRGRREAGKVR